MVGFIGTYVFGSKQKDHEGNFFSNIIIVENTDACNNKCYHIHHWIIGILILIMLIFFENSCIKSILQGAASAAFIDGLLFEDRFYIYKK